MWEQDFFKDFLVVELASVLAGPAVGLFFAELGARVVKIENKTTGGDVTRNWRVPGEDPKQVSAYYQHVNMGKEVLFLDLKTQEDQEKAKALITKADVVLSNFPEAKAAKMGMSEEILRALNPSLIFAHLSAFSKTSTRPAFDVVLQAEAGFLFMTGQPDGPPAKMPVALIDLLASHQLKEGILLAIIRKLQTGQGASVRTSLLEAAVASLANQANNWLVAGHIPQRMGSQHPNIAPYGDIFLTKDDKMVVLAVGTERHFTGLCEVLGLPDLPRDKRFENNAQRVEHRAHLVTLLEPAIQKFTRDELLNQLEKKEVPAGAIRTMPEVFELPEAAAMVQSYVLPDGSKRTALKTAVFRLE
ncbi:MAG: CoA transferase [Bacteroidota bacterium]